MNYTKEFHSFQKKYTTSYPSALRMRSYLPSLKNKAILDVGCGSGLDLTFFKQNGAKHICGVDISSELVAIAQETHPTFDIRNESFEYLTWKNASFDVVWSKYALNHAKDITMPLKEMFRVCKEGGTVLLQVTHPFRTFNFLPSKNYFDSSTFEYPIANGTTLQEYHHTIAEWLNAITDAGFEIIKCEEILNKPVKKYRDSITPSAIILVLKK